MTGSQGRKHKKVLLHLSIDATIAISKIDESFIGTDNYMGLAYFWSVDNDYKHMLRDCGPLKRSRIHGELLSLNLSLNGNSEEHHKIFKKHMGHKARDIRNITNSRLKTIPTNGSANDV